jgi:HEAT repeat protein
VDFLDSRVQRGRDSVLTYGFHPMRRVTEETVNRLALDLLNETYPLRRLALMRAFRHRPFPKGHMWLMPYVQSDDEAVREAAIRALAQIRHGDIRELAVRGATSDMRADLVAELLVRNVRQGDEPLLLELARRDLNQDIYHWMGIDVRRILQGNPALDSRAICLELHERGPCSMCRYSVVELLRCTGALPDWIRAELPFDAYRSTRELAAQNQPL